MRSAGPGISASQKGFFADAGITLDVIYVPTASGLVQQLSAGSLDIVADVGVVEPIHAVEKGAPVGLLRIVGQVSAYEMMAKPTIATVKDLKGKTICIGGLVDINRVYLERIMQANGLKDGDYDITVVGNTAGRFAALKSGAADATLLAPPVSFFAEDSGFHSVGMIMDYAPDLPFSGTDVSLAYAAAHRDTLVKLLAVIDKSVAWFDDPANRTEAVDILVKEMKSAREPVERSYDFLRKINYFAPTNDNLARAHAEPDQCHERARRHQDRHHPRQDRGARPHAPGRLIWQFNSKEPSCSVSSIISPSPATTTRCSACSIAPCSG